MQKTWEYMIKTIFQVLRDHWCAYVRVNYQFGLNAVRNSRPQDFIWIHDYHLMLTGQMMRSLDSNLEVGVDQTCSLVLKTMQMCCTAAIRRHKISYFCSLGHVVVCHPARIPFL